MAPPAPAPAPAPAPSALDHARNAVERVREVAERVDREMRSHGVDPAAVLAGVVVLHVWRFFRRVARLERRVATLEAAAAEARAAAHAAEAGAKEAEAGAAAAWSDLSKGIKLPW